jgi:glycosyltransferase involved in cell wall biosynthesis
MHVALIEFRTSTPYPGQLANALSRLCQVTLLLPERAAELAAYVDRENVDLKLFRMPRLRQPANLAMVLRLRRQLQVLHPQLVHVTYWHPWATPGLGMFARLPLVATVHDVTRHTGERGVWAIPPALYRWQWRWADQVIVHADDARKQLLNGYGHAPAPESIHVIPIGAYGFYRAVAQEDLAEEPNTVLFFGRIWGYKGLQTLIEAEPLISEEVPDVRIIIAGQGEPIEKYTRAMVNPLHFELHNYRIPDRDVASYFQRASVVALPYIEASQSGVVPIAYTFGKPVVATPVGGLPDVVIDGRTGVLVPPGNSRRLADAIITLLKDAQLRRQMGRQAQQFAETELSWGRIAARTMEVYRKAVPRGDGDA